MPRDARLTATESDGLPSEAWARSLRRGEVTAVEKVRQRVTKILSHRRLAIPLKEREDLAQEITTEIWQAVHRPAFDPSAGFWSFVEIVASRRSIDWLRTRREIVSLPEELEGETQGPLKETLRRERAELAAKLLSSLDAGCRRLIEFRLRDGLSYREIATRQGKSEGALRVQFYRCIDRARVIASRSNEDEK